jgi:hypothetical protein
MEGIGGIGLVFSLGRAMGDFLRLFFHMAGG